MRSDCFETTEDVIKFLHYIRKRRLCSYLGYSCDCKYGIGDDLKDKSIEEIRRPKDLKDDLLPTGGSEKTGCPELWNIIDMFCWMTDEEFEMINNRKNKVNE